ncbi:GatB/YqeY domain-containing protein [Imperialibacter roseus]|uniref:GatB/YqeY domain-containing protein n=1 Tax=Imperialibacter roseus TaxID=1324217 RepID=A0ABZ0IRU1_9BACT|nr:GatB/YqeY domain-containing protein [Imperialibacter roseus]WOK06441.1 GatB/YqeY domain-containing protein [Imperialibacter roseus]|tara:strand:- start:42166 stop:42618 length:453 start_codon:yes stop_codon:yes gene_type:complete
MSLKTQIDGDIKQAMLSKNSERLRALRAIKSLILLAESEKGAKAELDQAAEMAILTKAAKQRKDSLAIFEEQNRPDLAEKEQAELDVINEFLPKQLSEEEVKSEVAKIIAQVGASSPQDMGKVMGAATKALAGKADGKLISTLVKELLSK